MISSSIERTVDGFGRSRAGGVLVLLFGVAAIGFGAESGARAQEAGSSGQVTVAIRDSAGLFGADAIATAQGELTRAARESGASIIIETVESLGGEPAERVAIAHARRSGIRGIYLLIARKEHKIETMGSERYRELLTRDHIRAISDAFAQGFRRQDYNAGLERGVAELARILAATRRVPAEGSHSPLPEAASDLGAAPSVMTSGARTTGESPLVARNQVRLTLAGARAIIAGAEAKSQALGVKSNIAVVDDGGHLIAFERMEGARPASIYTALTKAATAATFRQPSGPMSTGGSVDLHLSLSLQNAAAASGGKFTSLKGGVPVIVDGQVIGGVGVGGGTGEQDARVAEAGMQAMTDLLARPATAGADRVPSGSGAGGPTANPAAAPGPASSSAKPDSPTPPAGGAAAEKSSNPDF